MSYEHGSDSQQLRRYGYLKRSNSEQVWTCSQANQGTSSTSATKQWIRCVVTSFNCEHAVYFFLVTVQLLPVMNIVDDFHD
jgi:hypothetical protein